MLDIVRGLAQSLLVGMGFEITSMEATFEEEARNIILVTVRTPDSKLLIGMHGRTLEAIVTILTRMADRATDASTRIHLEVNDYLSSRDAKLFSFIDSKIARVLSSGQEISIPNLSSYERKKVHSYLSEKNIVGVRTYSVGEGRDRHLCIALDSSKGPHIDIAEDGIGI